MKKKGKKWELIGKSKLDHLFVINPRVRVNLAVARGFTERKAKARKEDDEWLRAERVEEGLKNQRGFTARRRRRDRKREEEERRGREKRIDSNRQLRAVMDSGTRALLLFCCDFVVYG